MDTSPFYNHREEGMDESTMVEELLENESIDEDMNLNGHAGDFETRIEPEDAIIEENNSDSDSEANAIPEVNDRRWETDNWPVLDDVEEESMDGLTGSSLLTSRGDTSAQDLVQGRDMQGIPWPDLHFTRETYRETRVSRYSNYTNVDRMAAGGDMDPLNEVDHSAEAQANALQKVSKEVKKGNNFYEFFYNSQAVESTIVHFQLRNLVWATSRNDVFLSHNYSIDHYSTRTRFGTSVLDLSRPIQMPPASSAVAPSAPPPNSRVQVSAMCVSGELLAVGGFYGELIVKRLEPLGQRIAFCSTLTNDDNPITNSVGIFEASSGSRRIFAANNDCVVRILDSCNFRSVFQQAFDWPVNHLSVSPDRKTLLVVGDDPNGLLVDSQSGQTISELKGHFDYSFATAWHPGGTYCATGNQDKSCRIWDVRNLKSSLHVLRGNIGAIRSIRFTEDGRFMAMAEAADFVHVFDALTDFGEGQEIDIFGEIGGISFSPDGEALFVGIADRTYGSLLEFDRYHNYSNFDYFV